MLKWHCYLLFNEYNLIMQLNQSSEPHISAAQITLNGLKNVLYVLDVVPSLTFEAVNRIYIADVPLHHTIPVTIESEA